MKRLGAIFVYLFFLFSVSLTAQVSRTSLNGTVTDEQGRRIPAAKVRVTNLATGLRHETETGSQGGYTLPALETGAFTVEAAKEGFASYRLPTVKLEVGQPRTLDVVLAVVEHRDQISVSEVEFQLDRVDATCGRIRSMTAASTAAIPIHRRTRSAALATKPAATSTFVTSSISPPSMRFR